MERGADGAVLASVTDDGSDMTRAIIEGPLLTLFESSKESDPTKRQVRHRVRIRVRARTRPWTYARAPPISCRHRRLRSLGSA